MKILATVLSIVLACSVLAQDGTGPAIRNNNGRGTNTTIVDGVFSGNGGGLTNVNAATLASGGVPAFTVVLIPDTQYLYNSSSNLFKNMMTWIETNRTSLNIAAAIGLGDVVESPTCEPCLIAATNAYKQITNTTILANGGNHDFNSPRDYSIFNTSMFPRSFYTNKTWWTGGFYTNGEQQNLYITVTNGLVKLLIVGLEFGPTTNQILWASNLASLYPDHYVMVSSHNYLMQDGTRNIYPTDPFSPQSYGVGYTNACDGNSMWELLKSVPNLKFIVGGHQLGPPLENHSVAVGTNGSLVHQIFCNHQTVAGTSGLSGGGGVARLRLLSFQADGLIYGRTFDVGSNAFLPEFNYSMTLSGIPLVPSLVAGSGISVTPANDGQQVTIASSVATNSFLTTNSVLANFRAPQDNGLIFYATLDEGQGTSFLDSAYGMRGVLQGSPPTFPGWLPRTNAYLGNSAVTFFDGTNSIGFAAGTTAPLDKVISNITVSIWMRNISMAADSYLIAKHEAGNDGSFFVRVNNANGAIATTVISSVGRSNLVSGATSVKDGNWHNVAFTWDGITIRSYVDGSQIATMPLSGTINRGLSTLRIGNFGSGGSGGGPPIGIYVDEAKIWNRTLNPKELSGFVFPPLVTITTNLFITNGMTITLSNGVVTGFSTP